MFETASALAKNVFAGTSTSSPGPRPAARGASEIASVPLATPRANAAPQYAANSLSKRSTTGPPTK